MWWFSSKKMFKNFHGNFFVNCERYSWWTFLTKTVKKNWYIMKNPRKSRWLFWKNADHDVFRFVIIDHFLIAFEKKHKVFTFSGFLRKPNFSKSASFCREIVILTNFGLDRHLYCQLDNFYEKKFTNFFWISFNELLKGITILITNIL